MSVRKRQWVTGKGEARTAWIVDYADGSGVRRQKTFIKKKDADAFAATAQVEVRDGTHVAESATVTVAEAGELWITSTEKRGLERATVDNYRRLLDLHIVPFIGRDKLSKLNVPSIRSFEDHLRSEGRSAGLVKKVLVSLGMLLADAQERGLVARNAVRDIRGRRSGGSDRHKIKLRVGVDIPSPGEIRSLFRALEDQRFAKWRALIVTAALTGMRVSELRGLRWQDVDCERLQIHVRQRADRFGAIGSPKSQAGRRVISITPMTAGILREWRLVYPTPVTGGWGGGGRIAEHEAPKPENLVFSNSKGNVEMLTNILRRGLWPACEAAGLTVQAMKDGKPVVDGQGQPVMEAKYSMHALRHFFASWCINRPADGGLGLPPKVVQDRLGHSSISMTMDTYGHLFPISENTDETEAAERALFA